MYPHIIAAACNTGSIQQKWNCGWKQPTTNAANVGAFAGHNVVPALVGLLLVVLIIALLTRRRSPATS